MTPRWHFHPHDPAARIRDAIQGEFFASESIKNAAEALIREAIQNALDAKANGGPVKVRLYISEAEHALPADRMKKLYALGMWEHIQADGNGLKDPPAPEEPCPFLVLEDFGTTGLTGDITQCYPKTDDHNPFFYFFRADGRTDKHRGKGGSWGVGKTVFPRSSRANCFFGYTIRFDDEDRWLLGSMTLRTHTVDDVCYDPDALFGIKQEDGEPRIVMPSGDEDLHHAFIRDFRLARRDEPGLSIVVPWPDPSITRDELFSAVLRQWFFPILTGQLVVLLETPRSGTTIDRNTIWDQLEKCEPPVKQELTPLFELTAAWTHATAAPIQLAAPGDGAPRWKETMVPDGTAAQIRQTIDAGKPAVVRVPVIVRPKRHASAPSYFDICVMRDDDAPRGSVTFVRNGVVIPEVRAPRARGIRALVVAEHGPLADLLRDAENPAHTQWHRDTSNFREKYDYGPTFLSFVQQSVHQLMFLVQTEDEQEDTDLLADIFALSSEELETEEDREETRRQATVKGQHHDESEPPPVPPEGRPQRYLLDKVVGGFRIMSGPDPSASPDRLRIHVAYDRRTKNPFSRWSKDDFELDVNWISPGYYGVSFEKVERNIILASITAPEFRFEVRGFDRRRDLIVDVQAIGGNNDSTA